MAIKVPGIPELRLHSPFWQNIIMGYLVALTAGLYVALNLLGAGGGRPNNAQTVQIVNATLCSVWFFSSSFGGSVLNTIGPAVTAPLGVCGYMVYVGSLWYFDATGKEGFPIAAGVLIGIGSGLVFVTMGYIAMSYSEEDNRGSFITMSINIQACGSIVGGIIPLIINRDSTVAAGVPPSVYIIFLVLQGTGAVAGFFLLQDPATIIRDDGTPIAAIKARGFVQELKANLEIFTDWKLLLMVPAFLPAECFLVYGGSVNAYHNNLRTRCLLGFISVVLQVPFGYGLQLILDHKAWHRRTRAFIGLAVVGIPLIGAWIWEIVRTRNYDRHATPGHLTDWTDGEFVAIFFLFMLNWIASSLWQYLILYYLGCFTNSPRKAANYAASIPLGVFRGFLGAGEAICFGLDSIGIPYIKEAGGIFAFYTTGVLIFLYMAAFHIEETKYFSGEEDVVIPKHVLEEHAVVGSRGDENQSGSKDGETQQKGSALEKVADASI
ncbi:uncharacterized protein LY89DRAFT_601886 [Mollisia scopiformis]|uniref:Uncharacterized protein n=1 Tax=Mollisia scopiformis TaxID=149040 RepID=A0A132B3W4_MOLSC|nr:uncharacterized protein LY89DRAFT_601886 [Mollisia scopiformis]KUJ07076.1 hypothetical protein LY89DRAFT_601886 [Mollisia scopiformis]